METFAEFSRQSEFLASLPPDMTLSPVSYYLLGVCQARTSLSPFCLLPFLKEVEISSQTGWLTSEEQRRVGFEVYIGAVGSARELLSACREGKVIEAEGELARLCDICGEQSLIGSGWVVDEECGHFSHLNCSQTAIRPILLRGRNEPIHCPVANCPVVLSPSHLARLFDSADCQVLQNCWKCSKQPTIEVLCPNFHCKASTLWPVSQYFACTHCGQTFCLHCLKLLNSASFPHTCGPHSEESLSIGVDFSQGKRFKACKRCGYWCSLVGDEKAICCCGEEICGKCVLKRNGCVCDQSLVERVLSLPREWMRRI